MVLGMNALNHAYGLLVIHRLYFAIANADIRHPAACSGIRLA
jgi:hypothetical protein